MNRERRRLSWSGSVRPGRSYVTLAALQTLFAVELVAYARWSPAAPTDTAAEIGLAMGMVFLAAFSYFMAPHLAPWGRDGSLAATWLAIAWVAASRPIAGGQVVLGLALLIVAVYIAYFLPRRRATVHVLLMLGAYGIALTVNPLVGNAFFGILVVTTVLAGALIVGRLRESDRLYRLLVDNSADVVYLSRRGIIQWMSPSISDVLGWDPAELVGNSSRDFWHPEDRDAAFALRDEAYDGKVGVGVFRFRSLDGHYRWVEITLKPYTDADGNSGAVGSMRDVTDRIDAEQALVASEQEYRLLAEMEAKRSQQLASLDEAKSRLFQNVSHEFRTPLTVIQGHLESVDGRLAVGLTDADRDELGAALRATERLTRLVDGLLDIARGEAGELAAALVPTDLAALTQECAAMFRSSAERAGLDLIVTTVAIPPVVMIDPEMWAKIVLNLLSNAVKFTRQGQVSVELAYLGGAAELRVFDTGVGIPKQDLPHIFDRFQQGASQAARGDAGTGIGLALVAEIVRALGGSIEADSTSGLGSAFTVRVPAVAVPVAGSVTSEVPPRRSPEFRPPPSEVADGYVHQNRAAHGDSVSAGETVGGRVLLVEDNADLRSYVTRLLRDDGWSVTAVPDAERAVPVVLSADVLITDVMLPGMDGIDLVRQVRAQDGEARWLPIIVLTARADGRSVVAGLTAGADDFMTKPFSADELRARVRNHMELSLLRQGVLDQAEVRAENLQSALGTNRVIGMAIGILMATSRISADAAFDQLRAVSQNSNRKLRDVADDVVLTGALPEAGSEAKGPQPRR